MAVLKCKMCGGDLILTEGSTVCECEFCGTLQTIPNADNEKKMNLFLRANRLRFNNEFDKAAGVYETIIADFPEEAEAYWGLVLCKYGIEYVDDPVTGKKIPTCHRSSFESIFDDNNFELVMENADAVSKRVYREEAKHIEDLRKGIIEVSSKEQPYDIFICYKETDENGGRTLDSVIAQDIYNALTEKGYRVFFSRITLEDKLGQEYEPYIFAALHSAKIMLAVGTNYEYYDAVWVKNEWSRYLQLIAAGEKKVLIPVYKNLDAYDMPKEFARLQAQDMGKVGAIQDLIRGIDKIIGKNNKKKEETTVIDSGLSALNAQTQALLKRGNMTLEDRDFTKANDFYEQVLNNNAETGAAYWGKLLCSYQAVDAKRLAEKLIQKIDGDKTGNEVKLPLPNLAQIAREADEDGILAGYSDKELEDIEIDLNEVSYLDCTDYYKLQTEKYNEISELTGIVDDRDFERALKYKDGHVENEQNKLLVTLKELLKDKLDSEKAKVEKAKEEHQQQDAFVRKEIENRLKSISGKALKLKKEAEEKQKAAEKKAEEDWTREVQTWENDYQARLRRWEQAKQDYEASCTAAETKKEELNGKISQLEKEKSNLTGLFTGKKRKEIENNIAVLRKAISEIKIADPPGDEPKEGEKPVKQNISMKIDSNSIRRAADEVLFPLASLIKGFGRFAYSGRGEKQPIEWRILKRDEDKALVISEKGIATMKYHEEVEDTTWEKCSLRKWLNWEFINTAFNEEERSRILKTKVTADENPEYKTDPGNDTEDKVFLLSILEANKYFSSDEDRAVKATEYAKAQGAHVVGEKDPKREGNSWWWLRSPGDYSLNAAFVDADGSVSEVGDDVGIGNSVVRPALWVKIN